jgi:hypothetical protein
VKKSVYLKSEAKQYFGSLGLERIPTINAGLENLFVRFSTNKILIDSSWGGRLSAPTLIAKISDY